MILSNKYFKYLYKYKRKFVCCANSLQYPKRFLATDVKKGLNVLFFGTDNFSLPSLKILHKNSSTDIINQLGTVTSFKNPANCVRLFASQQNIALHRWPVEAELCHNYDLGVVVSFGHLIPQKLIESFPLGMINVHASLLPRWRGAAPIIYAIMNGDQKTGVSIMKIEPKHFDIGDILAQREINIRPNVYMSELYVELAEHGANLLIDVLRDFHNKLSIATKQDNAAATYAPRITQSLTEVTWSNINAEQLHARFRALHGFKQLSAQFQGKTIILVDIKLPELITKEANILLHSQPGAFIYQRSRKCLFVRCANNSYIEVHQLRIEGKKIMSAMEFNNGYLKKQTIANLLFEIKKVAC